MASQYYYVMGFTSSSNNTTTTTTTTTTKYNNNNNNSSSSSDNNNNNDDDDGGKKLSNFIYQNILCKKKEQQLCIPPVAIHCSNTKQAEILFVSKSKLSESCWQDDIIGPLFLTASKVINIQVGFVVQSGEPILSCINRFMSKIVAQCDKKKKKVDDFYLDAYRIVTRGLMHYLDMRMWKMSKVNIVRLQRISTNLQNQIDAEMAKKDEIVSQIKMTILASHHVRILEESDPARYGDLAFETLEKHNEDILNMERQELDIMLETYILRRQKDHIHNILERQSEMILLHKNNNNNNNGAPLTNDDDDNNNNAAPKQGREKKRKVIRPCMK
jgi:hypothetical protein